MLHEVLVELRMLRADVQALKQDVQRYKGFVGGIMWCLGGISATGGFVWGLLVGHGGG